MADAKLSEKDIFEKVPVRKAILAVAVPTVISQLIVLIYNLADTWFIGQTGDPRQVAAVTVSYPLFLLLGGFGNLFGIGGGSMISRLLGREEAENAGKIGTFVIWSSVIATLLYSLVIFGFGRQALSVLDGCSRRNPDGTESGSCQYRPGSGQGENGKYRNIGGWSP